MKIWILNHTATPPSMGGLVRHYYFSKYLAAMGHEVKLFTSSMVHNTDVNMITGRELYKEVEMDGVPYTFVRSSNYKGNGFSRIWGMLEFPVRLWRACNRFELPDVIYTSSPDPITAFMSVLYARRKKLPCVVEVRDLWPESIVDYKGISRKNPVIRMLYRLEKWIYQHADRLIFTMEGGADYIRERGWDKTIDLAKVRNVNNGVDLKEFDANREAYPLSDPDLDDPDTFKAVYTGSVRLADDLNVLVETARCLQQRGDNKVRILVWGKGDEVEPLQAKAKSLGLQNILFKGFVEKRYIPSILSKADLNLIHAKQTPIGRFGLSMNKMFEYFAAGRPLLSDLPFRYNLIERYGAGTGVSGQDPHLLAQALRTYADMPQEEYTKQCANARRAAEDFDYPNLTQKLCAILEEARRVK